MTSGERLKHNLNLSNLRYVKIARAISTPQPLYFVWYDSRRPRFPVTVASIMRKPSVSQLFRGSDGYIEGIRTTPPILIEDFNATLSRALVVTIDMAGHNLIDRNVFENTSYVLPPHKLSEYLTLSDLKSHGMSDFTRTHRRTRTRAQGDENRLATLVDVDVNEQEDHVTFYFLTEATTAIYPDDHTYGEVDPDRSFTITPNADRSYTLQIRILNFFEWLSTYPEKSEITRQDIVEVFDTAYVQVFSDAPSFHWQGVNYYASQLDASIYPTDIAPRVWNADHLHGSGPYVADKHLGGLLRHISFFEQQMASMLTRKLRDRGILS